MGRPKASPEQHIYALDLLKQGLHNARSILLVLEQTFDTPVSLRTVERWVGDYKGGDEAIKCSDSIFRWHLMGEYGLPWEASEYLMRMWVYYCEELVALSPRSGEPLVPPPSVRQMKWMWRVHLAAPDLTEYDTWMVSCRFTLREMCHDLLGHADDMFDLEAHLTYRPWESDQSLDRYRSAIEAGHIPPLSIWLDKGTGTLHIPGIGTGIIRRYAAPIPGDIMLMAETSLMLDDRPELLPSQQHEIVERAHQARSQGANPGSNTEGVTG